MSKVKNPQEKKNLSYEKDRRNSYRENDKSSRKNIRKRKKQSSQLFRRAASNLARLTHHEIDATFSQEIESEVKVNEKINRLKSFKKEPDQSLKEHLKYQQDRRKIHE
ncbi:hypothetical protein QT397_14500 [Microbulbifer sp. MKSA007]|nr:hypothetical protein QT397_14500 [Microbulbifer sp. MKSA007]